MASPLKLNDRGYFAAPGINVLAFSNWYDGNFSDSKISGVELIHHEVRTATNGDVRLGPTPEQWDPIPRLLERRVDVERGSVEALLSYPDHGFQYSITIAARDGGALVRVDLARPLPRALEGRAGFNLEFLPSAYFRKAYLVDGRSGVFPRYPSGPTAAAEAGAPAPQPIARGRAIVLAPEDPERRVTIEALQGELLLFDGRNAAQNGWYVLRGLLPAGRSGAVLEWLVTPSAIAGWIRPPVIGHSQVGYHPDQPKVAVIELDPRDQPRGNARVLEVTPAGELVERYAGAPSGWGGYLRYGYATFDFSGVRADGLYVLEYGGARTAPFRIARDVYETAHHPTLDVFFPVQMDHVLVREAYRVWHGVPHLDDARQCPVSHEHFDLYAQGPATDTPYQPGEHIPGLNVGGWFDAGDFDIRTQTQYAVVLDLARAWEAFRITRDETTVDQERRYVEIHAPDGIPDILQQIEHGTLALVAQHRAVGHAICGIVEPDLRQYTHLGDASTKTDNLVYDPGLPAGQSDGAASGTPDDRWAFTSKSTPLNYGSIAALAAASRALRGYRDALADECLAIALRVWEEEHRHAPDLFSYGNTTGGRLETEELNAAVELLIATGDSRYARRVDELWPAIEQYFDETAVAAARALPYMSESYAAKLERRARDYSRQLERLRRENPYGVPIPTGGWAGGGVAIEFAITNYYLHKAFPALVPAESVFRGLSYVFGCHPGSDVSLVSGVGTVSKEIAYGSNRADFSFIAGGIVPGVLIVKPDFPENKEDWPFLWGENEYVVNVGASYVFLVSAVNDLLNGAG